MKLTKLLLLFCLPVAAISQTPAQVKQLTALATNFIQLYNAADTARSRAFIYSIDTTAARTASFLGQLRREQNFAGKVTVKNIRVVSPTETHALVQTPHFEAWWQLSVQTDSQQRFKEHHLRLLRVTEDVLENRTYTKTGIGAGIDSFIKRQEAWETFNGNVLVQREGETVYAKSFGTTNDGTPHRLSDAMGLASVGKLFTAVSIMQLVDAGKLSLDDSISKLLPELQNKALARVTVQQLLTHTSGMGDYFEDPQFQQRLDSTKAARTARHLPVTPVSLYLPYFESDALRFAPGTGWAYSNTGFELLGYLIEKTTGLSYNTYVQRQVLAPAGMTATNLGSGSGGGTTTVADLLRFTTALKQARLLSKDRTAEFFTYQVNDHYGWGSEHQKLGGETIVGHSGGFEKVCNEVNIYTKSGYTVIILSNSNPPYGHFLSDKIKTLLVPKVQ
jgi:CubicO group peptidase (beta-lactamase class C family)